MLFKLKASAIGTISSIWLENKKTPQVCWVSEWAAGVKKSNFPWIYLFPLTFYLLGKGSMWPHHWQKYLILNTLWSGRQISCPINRSQMQQTKYTTHVYGCHFWCMYDFMNNCKDTHFKWWLQSGIKTCNQTTEVFSQDDKIHLHISLYLYSANTSPTHLPSQ